jgi:mercuric ion transport protein
MRRTTLTGAGGVLAAFLGSLCCVGPLLFVTVGVGAGLASTLEPFRPAFGVLMVVCLSVAIWTVYGRRLPGALGGDRVTSDSGDTASCTAPMQRRRDIVILWAATAVAIVLWTFPTWSLWLL